MALSCASIRAHLSGSAEAGLESGDCLIRPPPALPLCLPTTCLPGVAGLGILEVGELRGEAYEAPWLRFNVGPLYERRDEWDA